MKSIEAVRSWISVALKLGFWQPSELTSLKVKQGNTNAAGSSRDTNSCEKPTFVGLNPELLG